MHTLCPATACKTMTCTWATGMVRTRSVPTMVRTRVRTKVRTRVRTKVQLVHTLCPVHMQKIWCAQWCAQGWQDLVRTRASPTVRTRVCTRRSAWCAQDPWRQRNFCKRPCAYIYAYTHTHIYLRDARWLVYFYCEFRTGSVGVRILLQWFFALRWLDLAPDVCHIHIWGTWVARSLARPMVLAFLRMFCKCLLACWVGYG